MGYSSIPSAYGHPFRPLGFVLYPFGVAFDYAVVRPLYMLGGLAPEWFGLTSDDAQTYQSHMPELDASRRTPRATASSRGPRPAERDSVRTAVLRWPARGTAYSRRL